MMFAKIQFSVALLGLEKVLRITAKRYPEFAARLNEKDLAVQIKLRDDSQGRCFYVKNGKVTSKAGVHQADVAMAFQNAALAARIMKPEVDFLHAVKNFQIEVQGSDELAIWFSETLNMLLPVGVEYHTALVNG